MTHVPLAIMPLLVHCQADRPAMPARFRPRYEAFRAHRVRTGDHRDGLARLASRMAGTTWSFADLAEFNWGVRSPAEIEWCLANLVGCRERADDDSLQFADADQPGIVYLPELAQEPAATPFRALAHPQQRLIALATVGNRTNTHNRLCVRPAASLLFEPATGNLHRVPASILRVVETAAVALGTARTQLLEQRLLPPETSTYIASLRALLRAAGRQEGLEPDAATPSWLCELVLLSTRQLLYVTVPAWDQIRRTGTGRDLIATTRLRSAFPAESAPGTSPAFDGLLDEWCVGGADSLLDLFACGTAARLGPFAAAWDELPAALQNDWSRRHPGVFATPAARRAQFDAGPAARFARMAQGLDRLDQLDSQRLMPIAFANDLPAGTVGTAGQTALRLVLPHSEGASLADCCNLALQNDADVRLRLRLDGAASGHFAAAALLSALTCEIDWAPRPDADGQRRAVRLGLGEHLNSLCGRMEPTTAFVALEWSSSQTPGSWHCLGDVVGASEPDSRMVLRYQRWQLDWDGGRGAFRLQLAGTDAIPIGERRGITAIVRPTEALRLISAVLAAVDFQQLVQISGPSYDRLVGFGLQLVVQGGGALTPTSVEQATAFPGALGDERTASHAAAMLAPTGAYGLADLLLPEGKALLVAAFAPRVTRRDDADARAILMLIRSARSPRETANIVQRVPGPKSTVAAGRAWLLERLPETMRPELERLLPASPPAR